MSRRTAREHIFKMTFQTEFHEEGEIDEALEHYRQNIESVYEESPDEVEHLTNADMKFMKAEIQGIIENIGAIDDTINRYAEGWDTSRIDKVDLAILRLAVYEILFADDIPNKVSANEAVELAKLFSSDKSPMFINGVLGKVISNA